MQIRPKNAWRALKTTTDRGTLISGRGGLWRLYERWRAAVVATLWLTGAASSASAQNYKAQLQPDLNAYRGEGFEPPLVTTTEGLLALNRGYTFKLREGPRSFQQIYVGAGPYMAAQAQADFDAGLEQILNSSTDKYIRSARLTVGGGETDQLAPS
jgi:hypothetical protein